MEETTTPMPDNSYVTADIVEELPEEGTITEVETIPSEKQKPTIKKKIVTKKKPSEITMAETGSTSFDSVDISTSEPCDGISKEDEVGLLIDILKKTVPKQSISEDVEILQDKDKCEQPVSLKLKKVKVPEKREQKPKKIQKIHLKSRIKRVLFPPEVLTLTVTQLVLPTLENGIQSRNYKEAEKLPKRKSLKVKMPRKPETDLESYEPTTVEDEKEIPQEDEVTIKRPLLAMKPEKEEEEPKKLIIGKGKIPVEDTTTEDIKLRKEPIKKKSLVLMEEVK